MGEGGSPQTSTAFRKGVHMRLVKRLVIAAGSLLALVLAGGAHIKV